MASRTRVLYTGISGNLEQRVLQHKHKVKPGFTSRYNVKRLVYYEAYRDVREAIRREKQVKAWRRSKKVALIESMNPEWRDISEGWDVLKTLKPLNLSSRAKPRDLAAEVLQGR